jgi:Fe-S cluster assembly iron-binding protein IscA
MLTITPEATALVSSLRVQRGFPDGYGLRIYSAAAGDGQQALRIDFTEAPMSGDDVTESHGERLFVAPDVTDVLADQVLDAEEVDEQTRLVLHPS